MIDVDGGEEGEDGGRGARWRRGWRPRRCKCKDRQTESIDEEDEEDGTSADDQGERCLDRDGNEVEGSVEDNGMAMVRRMDGWMDGKKVMMRMIVSKAPREGSGGNDDDDDDDADDVSVEGS